MRQPTRTRVSRATVVSTVAHALLLVVLVSAGSGQGPPPALQSIIEGEFLSGFAPPPADADERATEAAPAPPQRSEPPTPRSATVALPPPPAATDADAPTPTEAPPDSAIATERTPAPPPAPESAGTELPTAEEPAQLLAASPTATATDDRATVSPSTPGEPLANAEQEMLTKRLASWTGQIAADEPEPKLAWREHGRQYTAVLRRQPATDAMGMDHLTVEVTTERDGNRMLTELRMTRVAFSNFAQFVDHWDPEVVIHDDEIDGRFHSNSEFRVSGGPGVRPVFRGKVTLAARDFETDSGLLGGIGWVNRHTMFPAGLQTMVHRISLAPRLPPDAPEGDVQRFEHDTAITFYDDGSYGWRAIGTGEPEHRRPLTDQPHYLIGTADDVTLEVQGTVKGTLLVYTPGRIVIVHDLRYAHDPRVPGAGDYLGLVAERSVEIAEPDVTGPGDLEVYASIYARSRFAVRRYLSRPAGKLIIYGSLSAGSLTATEPRYSTSVRFDQRLTTMRAPGFPLSDRYELESSSGEWRIADPAR